MDKCLFHPPAQTRDLTSMLSNRQYSGTIAAYVINASTSGSATFASPIWASASEVGMAVTGVKGVLVVGVAGVPLGSEGLPREVFMSGVVKGVERALRELVLVLDMVP